MIDIHCHIIPGIDDGSKSIEETFALLREAAEEGITDIILTPHYIKGYYETNTNIREYWIEALNKGLKELKIPVNVYVGNEIYVCEDMDRLLHEHIVSTLANSRYVLFELPMNTQIKYLDEILFKISNLDLIPVIAHPERYSYFQKNPQLAIDLHKQGVLFQSNYGSILELYGHDAKKTMIKLLKEDCVDFLGSDVHKENTIYQALEESKKQIKKVIGKEKLQKLSEENPRKILLNEK